MKELLQSSSTAIYNIADETTDIRDKSIFNVVESIRGKTYLHGSLQPFHLQPVNSEVPTNITSR